MPKAKESVTYKVPSSAEQLMIDFYAMAGLKVKAVEYGLAAYDTARSDIELGSFIRDHELAREAVQVRQQVIDAERGRLLRDLPLINAAEVKHLFDSMCKPKSGSSESIFKERFGTGGTKWLKVFRSVLNGKNEYTPIEKPAAFHSGGYVPRYIAAETASRETGIPLVEVAMLVFDTTFFGWSSSYGGPKWLVIAEAWADLLDAQTEEEIIHWIDIINALQHNTTTLFNKCAHYGSSLSFLSKVLDIKFAARTPLSFVGKCSKQIQPYLLAVRDGIAALDAQVRDLSASRYYYDAEKTLWVEREIDLGKKGSPEAMGFVKTLDLQGVITLMYEGIQRSFKVSEVVIAIDGSRQFIMRANGWTKYKPGTSVSISYFPFDEAELVSMFVAAGNKGSAASTFKKVKVATPVEPTEFDKLNAFSSKLRNKIGLLGNPTGISTGALHVQNDTFRIRLHVPGKTNCRYYLKSVAGGEKFTLHFSFSNEASSDVNQMTPLISEAIGFEKDQAKLMKEMAEAIVNHAAEVFANDGPSAVPFKMGAGIKVNPAPASPAFVTHIAPPALDGDKLLDALGTGKQTKVTSAQSALSDLTLDDIEETVVVGAKIGELSFLDSKPVASAALDKHVNLMGGHPVNWKKNGIVCIGEFSKATHFTDGDKVFSVIQQVHAGTNQVVNLWSGSKGIIEAEHTDFSSKELAASFFKHSCDNKLTLGYSQKAVTLGG